MITSLYIIFDDFMVTNVRGT